MIILGLAAYVLDLIGDMTLPALSAACRHSDRPLVGWAVLQKNDDWRDVKKAYREVAGIGGDRQKWKDRKAHWGQVLHMVFNGASMMTRFLVTADRMEHWPGLIRRMT